MSKDPAFLFYSSDFLTGTMFMSDKQVGKYIRLLCSQHQHGHISEKDMMKICETYDEDIFEKFVKDDTGKHYNERLEREVNRRTAYSDSRRKNRSIKQTDMSNICKTYDEHMETETETETDTVITTKEKGSRGKPFTKPTLDEVVSYCKERNNSISGQAFLDYYDTRGWILSTGRKMADWQAAVRTWENREKQKNKPKQSEAERILNL